MKKNNNEQKEFTVKKIEKNNNDIKKWTITAVVLAFTNAFAISSFITVLGHDISADLLLEAHTIFATTLLAVPLLATSNFEVFRSISKLETENCKLKNDYAFKVLDESEANQKLQKEYAIYKIDKAEKEARRNRLFKGSFAAIGLMNLLIHISFLAKPDGNSLSLLQNLIHAAAYCFSFTCVQKFSAREARFDKISDRLKAKYDISEEEIGLTR